MVRISDPVLLPVFIIFLIIFIQCQPADDSPNILDWIDQETYRWAPLNVPAKGETGFELLAPPVTGIDFQNQLTQQQIVDNRNLLNGSGVAVGDVTGNGFPDIYFCRLNGPNVLYENLGSWQFRDITERAGIALPDQFSTGAVFADLNGNGYLDLIVTSNDDSNKIFFNNGEGIFTEQVNALPTDRNYGSTSIAVADINGNGAPDIYITNYKHRSVRDIYPYEDQFRFIIELVDGEYRVTDKFIEHYTLEIRDSILVWLETAEPDLLYLNDGTGSFTRVSLDSGVFLDEDGEPITEHLLDWGLHAKFYDINGNGRPDLYVCNDFESPDRIWLNKGNGQFQAIPRHAVRKTSISSMAVDFSDIMRDGFTDIFVIEMLSREHSKRKRQMGTSAPSPVIAGEIYNRPQYLGNVLQLNRGDVTFAEISEYSGTRRSDWSWSTLFMDINLNGYEDILITTGHYYDVQDFDANNRIRNRIAMGLLSPERSMLMYPRLEEQNVIFKNNADLTFENIGERWGFTERNISHGMALADLNNDGSLDIIMNKMESPAGIYRNKTNAPRVAVRLRGNTPNTQAIGSKIYFRGGPVEQTKQLVVGGAYLSSSDPLYIFAAGDENELFEIEVEWYNGKRSVIGDIRKNRIYEIHEPDAGPINQRQDQFNSTPHFQDVSHLIAHTHREAPFDDFRRQPLLPKKLSQPGPGIAWHDVTGNGYDDLMITSGRGGSFSLLKNNGDGSFSNMQDPDLISIAPRDQTAVIAWDGKNNTKSIILGQCSYESDIPDDEAATHYLIEGGLILKNDSFIGNASSTGAIALGDYSGNGSLDVFVGGRVIPGRYPEPASSRLYKNSDGNFILDEENSKLLENIGLVNGAVFSDLDGDGMPELILAIDWGPIRVFKNNNGSFTDVTESYGLDQYIGWWNGVATGDLNGNGKMDIIATNWGLNHPYTLTEDPVHIYYGDLNRNGTLDIIEAYRDPYLDEIVPRRGFSILRNSLPHIQNTIRTFEQYSTLNLQTVIGPDLQNARHMTANTFAHVIFFNKGDRFELQPLPVKAQLSTAFSVAIADLNGNGFEDIFISQNFFAYHLETPRNDAGRSLWLKGDGTGNFIPVPGHISGIEVYGEQRAAALADFNNDGRIDIAVSQNAAGTKLFKNVGAKPGMRIRLDGTESNPKGIGAQIRIVYENHEGPLREIQAGSGYLSQNSSVAVLGLQESPMGLWVRWPGGETIQYELPSDAAEVVAGIDGSLTVTNRFE